MIIPIYIPIIITVILTAIFAVITGFQMYHVYSFGVWDKLNIGVAAAFLIVNFVLLAVIIVLIIGTDWSQPVANISLPSLPSLN